MWIEIKSITNIKQANWLYCKRVRETCESTPKPNATANRKIRKSQLTPTEYLLLRESFYQTISGYISCSRFNIIFNRCCMKWKRYELFGKLYNNLLTEIIRPIVMGSYYLLLRSWNISVICYRLQYQTIRKKR